MVHHDATDARSQATDTAVLEPTRHTVTLSRDAASVIAGLVAPSLDVNHAGVITTDAVWNEIRDAFPLELFHDWAAAHPPTDDGDQYYESDLEP